MTTGPSRRRFLAGAGLLGLTGVVAACTNAAPTAPAPSATGSTAASAPPTSTTAPAVPTYQGDAATVALCAALSALAADLCAQAGAGAVQGRYGPVPGVVSTFLAGVGAQSAEHARAWNEVLTAAGRPAVEGYPLTVETALRTRLGAAVAPVDLVGLARDVSDLVAATVVAALGTLADPAAITVAAGVAPVAAMHRSTAGFLLGRPPGAPVDPTAGALGPEALTV